MNITRTLLLALVLAISCNVFAAKTKVHANNYPTLDRVQYVLECAQNYPDKPHQEMIYKCSCAVDEIAKQIAYDDFINAWTSAKAITIAGDRGAIREDKMVKSMAKLFKDSQASAQKTCLFN
ncbi:MAG: hypothetical protein ABIP64_15355 [Burkholderiales bacterium]